MHKRYPTYKKLELAWMPELPSHWQLRPLWSLFRRDKTIDHPDEQRLSVYREYGVIPTDSRDDNHNNPSEDLSQYQLVREGDLVVNKMKAWQGSVGISRFRGIVSPAYFVLEALADPDPGYLHHLLRSRNYIAAYGAISKGIRVGQWDLQPEYFTRLPVVLPPKDEQSAIAKVIEQETARTDALIAEQERLIALLQEKRQAVISHAVTKGLDPNVPTKDSGVRWIGRIPKHWSVQHCSRVLSVTPGFAFPAEEFSNDEADTRLLRGINVSVSSIRWDDTVYWRRNPGDGLDRFELCEGDVVLGMDRPVIGGGVRVATISEADVPCLLLQRVALLRPEAALSSRFLAHVLSTSMFSAHFLPDTTGVSVPHISPAQIRSFVIALPPIEEQTRIVSYIDRETSAISAVIADAEQSMLLLRERRTALITAAVTGQIDVRGLVETAA